MISKIHVKALKSIKDLTVKCAKLNLFVGVNSSGKSTFLQALLILMQQNLNGKYVSLGEFREVRNLYMPEETIKIEVLSSDSKKTWIEFKEDDEKDGYSIKSSIDEPGVLESTLEEEELLGTYNFYYLSCHRIGANDIYAKNMVNESNFGIDGEYALAYLLKNGSEPVSDGLSVEDKNITNSLLEQVNYWLNFIVGTTLYINDIKKTNYLQARYYNNPKNAGAETMYSRPINVGSGVSYLISIIISCLGAEKESIIIIENPEIHLHPKAQSRLCDFLYFVSKAGCQLFIESHSDHIFNGLRAKVATKKIQEKDIAVNFFAVNEEWETKCNPICFKEYGKIVGTNDEMDIDDLFDQFEIDLNKMLGLE